MGSVCLDLANTTLRASLSGTFLQRKDVVNECLEFELTLDYAVRIEVAVAWGEKRDDNRQNKQYTTLHNPDS